MTLICGRLASKLSLDNNWFAPPAFHLVSEDCCSTLNNHMDVLRSQTQTPDVSSAFSSKPNEDAETNKTL